MWSSAALAHQHVSFHIYLLIAKYLIIYTDIIIIMQYFHLFTILAFFSI